MVAAWIITLIITIALQVVAYVLQPKPKVAKPSAAEDLEDPTADMGRPIPVIFGTVTIKGLNVLGFWDKSKYESEVDA